MLAVFLPFFAEPLKSPSHSQSHATLTDRRRAKIDLAGNTGAPAHWLQ